MFWVTIQDQFSTLKKWRLFCHKTVDDATQTGLQKAKNDGHGPRRSILFMTVSGEEKGLWGSKYYADNPVYNLENTVVDLNIDMIGRRDDEHDYDNYMYLIGADRISMDLHLISEMVNKRYIKFQGLPNSKVNSNSKVCKMQIQMWQT